MFLLVPGGNVGAHLDSKTAGAHELLKTVRIFVYRKWSIKRRFSNKRCTFTEIKKICQVSRVCLGREPK